MEGITVLSTEVVDKTTGGMILIAASVFIFLALIIGVLYQGIVDGADICVLIVATLVLSFFFRVGIWALNYHCTLQKVTIDDTVSFNEFMENYEIKGHEGDIWKVVPKEELNDET